MSALLQGLSPTHPTASLHPLADLNGYLLQMEENIADFAAELGCTALEQQYRQLATNRWVYRV